MKIIFVLLFLLSGSVGITQIPRGETINFLDQFRKSVNEDTLFYTAGIDSTILVNMRRIFITDTIWVYKDLGTGKLKRIDSIILTPSEKHCIESELLNQIEKIWGDHLLHKSKLSTDTLYEAYKNEPLEVRMFGWRDKYRIENFKTLYSFSRPIFLKNNSFCLFHYQVRKGRMSSGNIGIYKKYNEEWKFVNWYQAW